METLNYININKNLDRLLSINTNSNNKKELKHKLINPEIEELIKPIIDTSKISEFTKSSDFWLNVGFVLALFAALAEVISISLYGSNTVNIIILILILLATFAYIIYSFQINDNTGIIYNYMRAIIIIIAVVFAIYMVYYAGKTCSCPKGYFDF